MKRIIGSMLTVVALLAMLSVAAVADIPTPVDYWVWFHKIGTVPTWEYWQGPNYYGLPTFNYDDDWAWWHVPNCMMADYRKVFYWEVEWMPGFAPVTAPILYLRAAEGAVVALEPIYNGGNWSWSHYYNCALQPGWEEIYWDVNNTQYYNWFHNLQNVVKIEIGTRCVPVPEPSSLLALAAGMAALGSIMRLRKR